MDYRLTDCVCCVSGVCCVLGEYFDYCWLTGYRESRLFGNCEYCECYEYCECCEFDEHGEYSVDFLGLIGRLKVKNTLD